VKNAMRTEEGNKLITHMFEKRKTNGRETVTPKQRVAPEIF